ncbi:MAG: hypothetical protein ACSHXZ_14920 [Gammaproteobacteria bacterium]
MANYIEEFNAESKAATERKRQLDFDDLQRELSGVDVGRIARFLSPEVRDAIHEAKTGQSRFGMKLSALVSLLMDDPEYARMYDAAVDENRAARNKHNAFEDRLEQSTLRAREDVDHSTEQAVTLPDGRKAHLDKDGVAWAVDNERIDSAVAEGIDWTGHETRESHLAKVKRLSALEELEQQSNGLGMRLGEIADALHDEDTPPSKDELKAFREEQDAIVEQIDEMDQSVHKALSGPAPDQGVQSNLSALAELGSLPELN